MTAPTSLPSPVGAGLPDPRTRALAATCDVCPHPAASHDRIGQRFCDATLAGAVTRGCICRA
jgi:hypothetical protein